MKRLLIATTALSLLAVPISGAFAQDWNGRHDDRNSMTMQRHFNDRNNSMMAQQQNNDRHDNDRYGRQDRHTNYGHHNWRRGGRIDRNDWNRGQRVNDWQHRHLQRPPRGYEWRQVDNNYVLAAVAGGLIASVILANSH